MVCCVVQQSMYVLSTQADDLGCIHTIWHARLVSYSCSRQHNKGTLLLKCCTLDHDVGDTVVCKRIVRVSRTQPTSIRTVSNRLARPSSTSSVTTFSVILGTREFLKSSRVSVLFSPLLVKLWPIVNAYTVRTYDYCVFSTTCSRTDSQQPNQATTKELPATTKHCCRRTDVKQDASFTYVQCQQALRVALWNSCWMGTMGSFQARSLF